MAKDYTTATASASAAAAAGEGWRNSNSHLLEELEALSQTRYQSHSTTRRTASLALPRTHDSANVTVTETKFEDNNIKSGPGLRSRRMSLSPWRTFRPKPDDSQNDQPRSSNQSEEKTGSAEKKKGIWNWKPIRVLTRLGMQKLSCLLSVQVVTARSLPASMNGLRLSVCVRKKETRDGSVNTLPSRVSQGAADFEETLFIKFHVYCSHGNGKQQQQLKFEPRPFWIYAFAADAKELEFGRNSVDLSRLIQESVEKSYQGTRVRQWDMSFSLSGKAKGGELVVKLGFQIMEKDGGIGIYNNINQGGLKSRTFSTSFARKQSRTSFSVPSPRLSSRSQAWTPSQLQGLNEFDLDEPAFASLQKTEKAEKMVDDVDFPDFDFVDKGVEVQKKEEDNKSVSSEIVKEVVHDNQLHLTRLTELESIAQQIKALERMMGNGKLGQKDEETESRKLDADEETITREFLQFDKDEDSSEISDSKVYLPDLGKGLGCVVQTRDGGYLVSMNPFDSLVDRKDTPKLAMQMSKPMVFVQSLSGFRLFRKMAVVGLDKLCSQILNSMPLDELEGKTAEQVAFEGIASAIINGRNKERASSSAARIIAAVKNMADAMSSGRKERIATGVWNVNENPLTAEEILGLSLQKIEGMAVEALKVEAEMAEEDAPFDVSAVIYDKDQQKQPLDSAFPLENWIKDYRLLSSDDDKLGDREPETLTLAVLVQLRDPFRRYEAVGGPMLAVIHSSGATTDDDDGSGKSNKYVDEEKRFKVTSLDVGGLKVTTSGKRNLWDTERHRLTAMQWLVEHGLGKPGKKGKHLVSKGQDMLWSISSRVMADMWLKTMRNPDVKFAD